jgi:P-type Ca2+ transporter type 2C
MPVRCDNWPVTMSAAAAPADEPAALRSPHSSHADEVLAALGTSARDGLSEAEATARLARYGPNELQGEPPVPAWRRLLGQFNDPLVFLLIAAIVVSLGVWIAEGAADVPFEAIVIIAILVLNAFIGFVQEERAEQAVEALRAMTTTTASVIRDGQQQRIPSPELVPGDLVLIEAGDAVSADARLLEVTALQTAEAPLTGESEPVTKDPAPVEPDAGIGDRLDMVFSGTAATFGRGRAVVTATGMQTEMGRIAGLVTAAPTRDTPLQVEIARVGRYIGVAVVVIAVVVVATILLESTASGPQAIVDAMIVGVSLAVAAVPEGLAAVVTVTLALGVRRMAQRNAIVKKLNAVETLGSASVACSDKTGTLTRNEMTVVSVVTRLGRTEISGSGYAPEGALLGDGRPLEDTERIAEVRRTLAAATLVSNAVLIQKDDGWTVDGDPTEAALEVAARKAGVGRESLGSRFIRVGEVPFSPERKLMSTVHTDAVNEHLLGVFAKGAPDILLGRCTHEQVADGVEPLAPGRRAEIMAEIDRMASAALRTLGIAHRRVDRTDFGGASEDLERELVWLGAVGIIDPPRPEAAAAVATAASAGVRVIMITGDHPGTAAAIAGQLGISRPGEAAITGAALQKMDDAELFEVARTASVYARVSPEHKLRIVEALQRDDRVVAMTGDGVNDAPALKTADIGVAMGVTGTEVSKEAADMILTDDNFATIVHAIEEGRGIFANIRKFLRYLLSSNVGEVLTMFLGVVFAGVIGLKSDAEGLVVPLLATQILWINLLTDAAPALALGVDPPDPSVMEQPPRRLTDRVIDAEMWFFTILIGLTMGVATLATLDIGLPGGVVEGSGSVEEARTMAFTVLVFAQLFNAFSSRSAVRSAFLDLFSNRWLWAAVGISAALQLLVIYVPFLNQAFGTQPLTIADWLTCAAMASAVLWVAEAWKLARRLVFRGAPRP